jgi:phage tail-like protein
MAMNGRRVDPYAAFRFRVEIEGLVVGGFTEVGGLEMEIDVTSVREGGVNGYEHLLAGPARYPSRLALRRGLTDADGLWRWCRDVARGTIERRNGSVVLLDDRGGDAWRWNFVDAFPVRWAGPSLAANDWWVAMESVELVHRGLTKG